ncbi:hypothetical protein JCM6882_008742 [Rhodosporidiobolus microsporus]
MLAPSLLVAALVAGASSVEAFWRLPCGNSLVVERADTIVSPGAISGHVHNILGASNFALSSTFEELRASECTSCLVKQDMSNYWTPQLYFQWANGSFTNVDVVGGGLIYYLPRFHPTDTTNVTAFPDGLRMLTGNPFKRTYDSFSLMAQAIGWNCLGSNVADTRRPNLPTYNCPNGLRGEIRFPSCWNGKDLDSSDHFSHMAYPQGGESGPCPSTHPVRVVTLFYEIMWSVDPWKNLWSQAKNPSQPFVLAMGDASGYGYHGDFFNGWDRAVLQEAIDTCTSDSGVIEYCKVFDLYDSGHSCRKTPDVNEVVLGTLPKLPGCNPVTYAGETAVPCSESPLPELLTGVAYTGDAPPAGTKVPGNQPSVLASYTSSTGAQWTYQDCYSDLVSGRALTNGLSTANKTVEACLEACNAKGYAMCGVEYHGECWGGNELASWSTAQGASACGLTCNDNPLQYCGGTGGPGRATFEFYTRGAAAVSSSFSSSSVAPSSSTTTAVAPSTTTTTTTVAPTSTTTTPIVWIPAPTATSSSSSAAPTTTSSTTISTTTTTSSTTTSTSTTTQAASTTTSSAVASAIPTTKLTSDPAWAYQGCFADLQPGRSLPNGLSVAKWTVETCLAAAAAKNYSVAAVTYGGECWASNALSPYATPQAASKCNFKCNDDKAKECGGNGVLDVYFSTTRAVLTGPTKEELASFGTWRYDSCYADLVNGARSLDMAFTNSNKTVEACLGACAAKGATVCGLTYYGECFGSKTSISSSARKLADQKCRFPCAGNSAEMCGGDKALSVWKVAPQARLTFKQRKAVEEKRAREKRRYESKAAVARVF